MAIESITGKPVTTSIPAKPGVKDAAELKQRIESSVVSDTVEITATAQDIKTASAAGASASVVNEDRVAAIKAAIQAGSYQVNAERVAEKMLQFDKQLPDST
ncbi:flagellar biosynthesis anti-sigma factor FlgM [Methylomonas sp. SURF-1]|uniref:Negative regulator of flagellin synthesis n=1 Tax=Methylomonas aurea TaxID=2952224 RepID=A0ABT1UF09_9GAMM|nr:flagellar biosynthesis anti-sigma factor FlgM [Methylomonas sp. SURF-1]MCQ8180808.1 flagellar biosynthesis anti-sigma factor FlgM [Methylomonas sp. SURF-1]